MKALPPQSIDCFGFTCPLGMAVIESESHECIRAVLHHFDFLKRSDQADGPTVITDRAHAWSVPLQDVTTNHIFDTFHFNRDIQTHISSIENERFRKDMRRAVFELFDNFQELHDLLDTIQSYATDGAHQLVTFFKTHVKKIALTYTSKFFIGSKNGASSRQEGYMSTLKGKGCLKNRMADYSLFDLLSRHSILVETYEQRVSSAIKKMLKTSAQFTPPVHDAFLEATTLLFNFEVRSYSTTDYGHLLTLQSKNAIASSEVFVCIPNDLQIPPTCSCRQSTSMLLPCGCLAFAFVHSKSNREFLSLATVHRRWRHDFHPMYEMVTTSTIPVIHGMPESSLSPLFPRIAAIHVPPNVMRRNSLLSGLCQKIVDLSINEAWLYQRTYAAMTDYLQFLHKAKDNDNDVNQAVLHHSTLQAPRRKKSVSIKKLFVSKKNKPSKGIRRQASNTKQAEKEEVKKKVVPQEKLGSSSSSKSSASSSSSASIRKSTIFRKQCSSYNNDTSESEDYTQAEDTFITATKEDSDDEREKNRRFFSPTQAEINQSCASPKKKEPIRPGDVVFY